MKIFDRNNPIWHQHNIVITISILALLITLPLTILMVITTERPSDVRSRAAEITGNYDPPPPTATPTPPTGQSSIKIYAAGTDNEGDGIFPTMQLLMNNTIVKTFADIRGDPANRKFQEFSYTHPTKVAPEQVKVRFVNDKAKRNLRVDSVNIDGSFYEAEAPTTYTTGTWTKKSKCGPKYSQSERGYSYEHYEWLHCNGFFAFKYTIGDTIGVHRRKNGTFHLKYSNTSGNADLAFRYGRANKPDEEIGISGDWNGNGITTIGVYRPFDASWHLKNSNAQGTADIIFRFGPKRDDDNNIDPVPIVGDWNGDGKDTVGVFDRNSGTWYLKDAPANFSFNIPQVAGNKGTPNKARIIAVAGDWNGNGIDTVGLYNRHNATFYLKTQNRKEADIIKIVYGSSKQNDYPIVGDWDNDGVDTFGVYRGNRLLLTDNPKGGIADYRFRYGAGIDSNKIDYPLTGNWDGSPGAICRADFNHNGDIDIDDLQTFINDAQADCSIPLPTPTPILCETNADCSPDFGICQQGFCSQGSGPTYCRSDFNRNGDIDIEDLQVLIEDAQKDCSIAATPIPTLTPLPPADTLTPPPNLCGNDNCDPGETIENCPRDCNNDI